LTYNTVVSGTTITATWGNQARDQQVSVFASAAARDSAILVPLAGMMCYTSGDDTYWRYNGTKWLRNRRTFPISGIQTYTSISYADIPGFSFTADANATYTFTGWLHTVAPTSGDVSLQWVLPASAAIEWSLFSPASGNAGASLDTTVYQGAVVTTGLSIGGIGSSGVGAIPMGEITTAGTAGTCKIQGAQVTASGTSFIRASSWLAIEQTG
jgi:hypothetical protein